MPSLVLQLPGPTLFTCHVNIKSFHEREKKDDIHPASPEENMIETPLAPRVAKPLQTLFA